MVIAALPAGEYGIASAAGVAVNMQNSFPNIRIGLTVDMAAARQAKPRISASAMS